MSKKDHQAQDIDLDGDGKPDVTLSAFAQAAKGKDAEIAKSEHAAKAEAKQKSAAPKPAEDAPKTEVAQEFRRQKAEPHFKIIIPSTGKEDEVKRIFVGHNGVPYTIGRDEEVIVPKGVLNVLDDAQETRYRDKTNGDGTVTKVAYKVKSYPYEVLSEEDPTAPAGQNFGQ
jgi:hypothetical protein